MKNSIALVLLLALTFASPLRLHIIANSNSKEDQRVKLEVRDAVLAQMDAFEGVNSREDAVSALLKNGSLFSKTAENTLSDGGFDYGAKLMYGEFNFPRRVYEDKVYPKGKYDALRIVLGEGKGENWWCVMYPPLCLGKTKMPEKKIVFRSAIVDAVRGKK